MFDTQAFKTLIREAVREELSQQDNEQIYAGYADVKQFMEISGMSKRDMEDRVIPHPDFKHCVCRFDGGSKRYIHIKNGLSALDNILISRRN